MFSVIVEKKSQRATIDDVAREAGVSIATVSRVLNQPSSVAVKTVERVRVVIEALNYQPQAAARIVSGCSRVSRCRRRKRPPHQLRMHRFPCGATGDCRHLAMAGHGTGAR